MVIYPAVDIKNGRCVRLYQGDMNQATEYGEPYEMALAMAKRRRGIHPFSGFGLCIHRRFYQQRSGEKNM